MRWSRYRIVNDVLVAARTADHAAGQMIAFAGGEDEAELEREIQM